MKPKTKQPKTNKTKTKAKGGGGEGGLSLGNETDQNSPKQAQNIPKQPKTAQNKPKTSPKQTNQSRQGGRVGSELEDRFPKQKTENKTKPPFAGGREGGLDPSAGKQKKTIKS